MEDFTKDIPLDMGPLYFFDQMTFKKEKLTKRQCEEQIPHLKNDPTAKYCQKKSIDSKRLSIQTTSNEEEEFHSFGITQSSNVLKFTTSPKFSEKYLQKDLLEEYKLIASEILSELGKMLQKYAEYKITLPVGTVNLINYSWEDLTEGAYNKNYASKHLMLQQDKALQIDSKCLSVADLKGYKITKNSGEDCHMENHLVKAEKKHITLSKSLEKLSFANQKNCSQLCRENSLPVAIHFSLSSKTCLENGWIFLHPSSKSEALNWKIALSSAVKKLQVAIIQIKKEEAKLKKEGFDKRLILRHYNDPNDEPEVDKDGHTSQCFWFELLKGKPQMPKMLMGRPDPPDLWWNHFASQVIAMMFNQDGGLVLNKNGYIIREWIWSSKEKLDDPVEIWVNKFITVKISGRFAITLFYKWQPQSLTLSLAPVRHKRFPPYLHEKSFSNVNDISRETRKLSTAYKTKTKQTRFTNQTEDPSSLMHPVDTLDSEMDISPMNDVATVTELRSLQRKVKCLLFDWLDHYRFSCGLGSLHICKMLELPQKVVGKQRAPSVYVLEQCEKKIEIDTDKEYLRFQNTFLELKGVLKPSPVHCIQRTPASNESYRLPRLFESVGTPFASQLDCPVVLRRLLCRKEGLVCQCCALSIPEVTDLEYDHLIKKQLSSVDQVIIVCVFSPDEKNKTLKEVTRVHRELNRSRRMPCIESHLDPFRLLKYNIISASKFTGSNCPLLVQRHNVIPGIFLMYIRGKLLFANFIFNGYSTSAKDLQKQVVKTRNDYYMGYFLPTDFRVCRCCNVATMILIRAGVCSVCRCCRGPFQI